MDRQLTAAIDKAKKGEDVEALVKSIERRKLGLVDREFHQPVAGVKGSDWFRSLDCVDTRLSLAVLAEQGHLPKHGLEGPFGVVTELEYAKTCKQTLEAELHEAGKAGDATLREFVRMDRQLTAAIDKAKKGEDVEALVKSIERRKLGLVDREFHQPVAGVKGSDWFRSLDCVDTRLSLAVLAEQGHLPKHGLEGPFGVVTELEYAKTCKQNLEKELHQETTQPPPPPRVSLNTLHSFDLSQAQQGQLTVAATSPSGSDTTDPSLLNADAAIKNAYASNGFVGRHERDYARVGVSNPSNPDTWPQGETVLYFVAFDLFKTAAGATKAAEASRVDLVANDFTPITGSPLGEGEVVLQKIPAGSDVLSTIIILQRGQVVVKIASACRGCPLGTLPADAAAFAKAQLAQAEAKGLPR